MSRTTAAHRRQDAGRAERQAAPRPRTRLRDDVTRYLWAALRNPGQAVPQFITGLVFAALTTLLLGCTCVAVWRTTS
jgi:hypothetical protein